jgi:glycosyltransferase involved in cell wall biosynthesis
MRVELGIDADAFVLISVGNCHSESHCKIKNHQLILHAIAILPESMKSKIVYLHVGDEQIGLPERELAQKLGIVNQVRFLGIRDDVWKLLCASDSYVMSSLQEGLGNSTIEAAFSGIEMILTRVKGLVDFQSVIASGISYCELTPKSMARSIEEKFTNRRNITVNKDIRDSALKVFSLKSGVCRLVSLYR